MAKYKYCLVSNSSSSSFIIASKSSKAKITIEIDLTQYQVITNQEQLNNYFLESYADRNETIQELLEENYYKEQYRACIQALNQSKTLYCGIISNDSSDDVENLLYGGGVSQLKGKELEVIVGE